MAKSDNGYVLIISVSLLHAGDYLFIKTTAPVSFWSCICLNLFCQCI